MKYFFSFPKDEFAILIFKQQQPKNRPKGRNKFFGIFV
jgi:hypothetical protein